MIKYENRNMSIDIGSNDINKKYMAYSNECLRFNSWYHSKLINVYKINSLLIHLF